MEDRLATFIQHYERITRRMLSRCREPGLSIQLEIERQPVGIVTDQPRT